MTAGTIKHPVLPKYRRRLFRLSGSLCLLAVVAGPIFALSGRCGSGWASRQKITINCDAAAYSLSANLTNLPVFVSIASAAKDIFGVAQADRADILFTASSGATKLYDEIENTGTPGQRTLVVGILK